MAIRKRGKNSWQVYWREGEKIRSETFHSLHDAKKKEALVKYQKEFEPESLTHSNTDQGCIRTKGERPNSQEIEGARVVPSTPCGDTIGTLFLLFSREGNRSRQTIACQLSIMRKVLTRYGGTLLTDVSSVLLADIKAFVWSDDTLRDTSKARVLYTLKTLLRYGMDRGLVSQEIRFPRIPGGQTRAFIPPTPAELKAMYAASEPYMQRIIVLGAYTGARVGVCELFSLKWSNVDLTLWILRIDGSHKNVHSSYREVPIREGLRELFTQWYAEDSSQGLEYLVTRKGRPVKKITLPWKSMLARAGINRHIRPYDLRHAFGTELVAAGVDVGTVAKLMGHTNPTMLLTHYQYVSDVQKQAAVEKLPDPCMTT